MDKPLYSMHPSIINAVGPRVLRNLLISGVFAVPATAVWYLVRSPSSWGYGPSFAVVFSLCALVLNLREVWNAVRLWNTSYYFYRNHLVHEFELFKVVRTSIPYEKIINVKTNLSLWDRLCNAGDLELFLKDSTPSLFSLSYMKQPQKIEHLLQQMIHKRNSGK